MSNKRIHTSPAFIARSATSTWRRSAWDEARRAFQKELERDADDPAALFGLGRVAEAEADHERAAECFLHSVAINRFHPEAHFRLAQALHKLGRTADALTAVERSLAQRPNHREAAVLLAELKCQAPADR